MIQDVWFERDLRVRDNEALASAAEQGPVLPLYFAEPDLLCQQDSSSRHPAFCRESRSIPERDESRRQPCRLEQLSPQGDLFCNDA